MALLIASLFLGLAAAAPNAVCSQAPYKVILPLADNCFAKSYCSSKYPVPPVTSTTATSYFTSTVPASTTTTLSTIITPTVLITTTNNATITTTIGVSETQTISTTVTTTYTATTTSTSYSSTSGVTDASGNRYKRSADTAAVAAPIEERAATPSGYSRAKGTKVASVAAAFTGWDKNRIPTSVLSTACSCIQTPQTVKVEATSTVLTTSTSTISTTLTFTSPTTSIITDTETFTASAYSTTTSTVTTTSTSSVTTTSVASATATAFINLCGTQFTAPKGDPLKILCGQTGASGSQRQSLQVDNFMQCFLACDNDKYCGDFTFQFSTRQCLTYGPSDYDHKADTTANSDFVYGYYFP